MYQVVLVTFANNQEALEIGKILIKEKLAACINVLPVMTSIYQWKDELKIDDEVQMIIKTKSDRFEQLSTRISELHSYEFAEIIALEISKGNSSYLNWIKESLDV